MLSRVLKHYKRVEVQQQIVAASANKEAVGSFGGKGYAKRPDMLVYPNDVIEQVKNGVTSFHVSEESWSNPLRISVEMKKHEYDELRIGWDLVLDIDCPQWEFAKLTTLLFVKALQEHGIESITVKFSGNKGFHIGVPFEAFPSSVAVKGQSVLTKDLFPEGPRKIAAYLLDYIGRKHVAVEGDRVVFGGINGYTVRELEEKIGKNIDEMVKRTCENCGKAAAQSTKKILFTCTQCESTITGGEDEQYKSCPKCNILMDRAVIDASKKCCVKPQIVTSFNPLSIVDVDTVLIASRHLYRAPYSYHEKSGLVSIPIDPKRIMEFEKKEAEPDRISPGKWQFLNRNVRAGQGTKLLVEAIEFVARKERKLNELEELEKGEKKAMQEFEEVDFEVPEKFFPPCIQLTAKGLKDGKKRAVFVLINFLASCGWDYDKIEEWLKEWNKKNPEPLREQYFVGQVRYAKQHKKKVLPPNCDNTAYYKSMGICQPDNFCRYIKNPANYAIKKARYAQRDEGEGKKKVGKGKKEKVVEKHDAGKAAEKPTVDFSE